MTYSVIGSGYLANRIKEQLPNVELFGRERIDHISISHETIIVAAPTGNRLCVNANPEKDFNDCQHIINMLVNLKYQNLIYLSTVDVYHARKSINDNLHDRSPTHGYGANRYYLETQISRLPNSYIARLPSLCHSTIKKNILYDLLHNQWLDSISLQSTIQWYPITNLGNDLTKILNHGLKKVNLTSAPILNHSIITKFCPWLLDKLGKNNVPSVCYDIKTGHTNTGYWIDDDLIWNNFADFFRSIDKRRLVLYNMFLGDHNGYQNLQRRTKG